MKPIPRSIDALGFKLKVEQHSQAAITRAQGRPPNGGFYYGYLDPNVRIVISKDLSRQQKMEILLHEIGHEVELLITSCSLRRECNISEEPTFALFIRLYAGVLLSNPSGMTILNSWAGYIPLRMQPRP